MTATIDLYWLLGAIGAVLSFVLAAGGVGLRMYGESVMRRLDERFGAISSDLERHLDEERRAAVRMDQIERDIMALRAELPERYLRREDHIRTQSTIEAKLDALASKIESAQLRGLTHVA